MATVAVTGSSGFLGQRVRHHLVAGGHEVIDIDLRPPSDDGDLVFRAGDVRSGPDMQRALAGAEAVVHLAWAAPGGEPAHDVNVDGTRVVLHTARAHDVEAVVVMSSAMVYGAHADNTEPLGEQAPLRAGQDVAFVAQKLAVERVVAEQPPDSPRTIVMRPAMVVGADSDNLVTRSLQDHRLLAVRGHAPEMQFVHVDDLAAAIVAALDAGLSGPVNVACDGSIGTDDVRSLLGRAVVKLPPDVARTLVDRANDLGLTPLPGAALDWIMHPWVVDTSRLHEIGWRPSIDNHDAVGLLAAGARAEGATTARRVGVAAGVVGGVLALGVVARHRRSAGPLPDADRGLEADAPDDADVDDSSQAPTP